MPIQALLSRSGGRSGGGDNCVGMIKLDVPAQNPKNFGEGDGPIQKLKKSGMTIILVEQNLRFALKNADYVHIINKGAIVHSSGPKELNADPETKQRYLGV